MVAQEGELVPRVDGELVLEALAPLMRTLGREPKDAAFVVRKGKPRALPAKVVVELDPQGDPARFTTSEAEPLKTTERVTTFTTGFPFA